MLHLTLKKLRQNSSFTQQQVADALNIDRSTYAYYELGKTTPDIKTLVKLAKIFNVPFSKFLENEDLPRGVFDFEPTDYYYQSRARLSDTIYELKGLEKQLLIYFRILPTERQLAIMEQLKDEIKSIDLKDNKPEQK